jgi:hypothetical protein
VEKTVTIPLPSDTPTITVTADPADTTGMSVVGQITMPPQSDGAVDIDFGDDPDATPVHAQADDTGVVDFAHTYLYPGIYTITATPTCLCEYVASEGVSIPVTDGGKLATPAGLATTTTTDTSITVAWTAVTNADQYIVRYRKVGTAAYTLLPAAAGETATITGLTSGTGYEISVSAHDSTGLYTDSDFSADITAATTGATPATIAATPQTINSADGAAERTITITGTNWTPSTAVTLGLKPGIPGAGGTDVVTSTATASAAGAITDGSLVVPLNQAVGDYHIVANQDETTVDDTPVTVTNTPTGPQIAPDVTTINSAEPLPADRTITVDGTGFDATTAGTVTLFTGDAGTGGTEVASTDVTTDADGAFTDAAVVVPADQAAGGYHLVGTVAEGTADNTSITITDAQLAVPADLAVGTETDTTIPLTWTASAGADQYEVRWAPTGTTTWTVRAAVTTNTDTVDGLTASTGYDFQVRALDSTGAAVTSDWSTTVTGTTTA